MRGGVGGVLRNKNERQLSHRPCATAAQQPKKNEQALFQRRDQCFSWVLKRCFCSSIFLLVLIPSLHSTERRCRALCSRPRSPSHGANREEGSERGWSEEWERGRGESLPFAARVQRYVTGQTILSHAVPAYKPLHDQTMHAQRCANPRRRASPWFRQQQGWEEPREEDAYSVNPWSNLFSHSFWNDKKVTLSEEGENNTKMEQFPRKLHYVWGETHFVYRARFYRSRCCLSPRSEWIDSYLQKRMNPSVVGFVYRLK